MANNQYISPFVSDGDTFRSADKTSYDITSKEPLGGPINDPKSGFIHNYTPTNKYLDNFQAEASNNSAFGTEGDEVLSNSIFEITELDIENPLPLGGPNRTNIPNIPSGIYINTKTSNIHGENPYPGGTLMNKNGTPNKVMIQRWNKKDNYLNFMREESFKNPDDINDNTTPSSNINGEAKTELNIAKSITQGAISPLGSLPI